MAKPSVLIVEDEESIRKGLCDEIRKLDRAQPIIYKIGTTN